MNNKQESLRTMYSSFQGFFMDNPSLCKHKADAPFEVENGVCKLCNTRLTRIENIDGLYGEEEARALKILNRREVITK